MNLPPYASIGWSKYAPTGPLFKYLGTQSAGTEDLNQDAAASLLLYVAESSRRVLLHANCPFMATNHVL